MSRTVANPFICWYHYNDGDDVHGDDDGNLLSIVDKDGSYVAFYVLQIRNDTLSPLFKLGIAGVPKRLFK